MKINKLKIENFRGFENYEIVFGQQLTLLIGKNGTGKSSLLSALRKGLSFMFAKSNTQEKSLNESNNCNVRSFPLWDTRFDEIERIFCFPIRNSFEAQFNDKKIEWTSLKKKDPGSLHPSLYTDALKTVLHHYNSDLKDSKLPVFAFFSESYPHIKSNVGEKASKLIKMDVLPRDFGYYGWDDETNCVELWQRRFIKISNYLKDLKDDVEKTEEQIVFTESSIVNTDQFDELKLTETQDKIGKLKEQLIKLKADKKSIEFADEKRFIESKITTFTQSVTTKYSFVNKEFEIYRISVNRPDRKSYSLEFAFNDGRIMHFENLPAGYKRLLSIVIDIAFRSFILNKGSEPEGIVLIDEIELHLHPSLQQEVVPRFQKTFPKIQFIVTSHSLSVISNTPADGSENRIISLKNEGNTYSNSDLPNIYGIDYTTGLMDVMGAKFRPSYLDDLVNSYVILMSKGKLEAAEKIKAELVQIVGADNKAIEEEIRLKLGANL